ncbi:hypothetical protein [Brevibacterium aurantiacum]|uniref:Uncharacterized protein n=1 Tax=Brevibacterium aurantiacum TaxID=273384 RepID=A0A2A3YZQ8_BREAU|nr:hypothetical protein [Brevibacterium aurantiacum]PCC44748.1 hypothetical protein CIK65_00875 [Brevibacterium aurantiacum]
MTIQQVQAQRNRIHRAAALVALEHNAAGTTPHGQSMAEHAASVETEAIEQAENMAATGAMLWVHGAEMIADSLFDIAENMMAGRKP